MKKINALVLTALLAGAVSAQTHMHADASAMPMGNAQTEMPMAAPSDMAEGEIRKIDVANQKITLRHGEIKNLDMPAMTMVFQLKDPALLEKAKVGDKVRFRAEKAGGAMVVTALEPAP